MDASRLKSIPLFEPLTDEQLGAISILAEETSVAAGQELVREGDFSYEFFAIEEGEADVERGGEKVATLGPGDFFGETGLIEREQRNATVRANSSMRLITLTHWDLKRLQKRVPEVYEKIESKIAERS